MYTLISKWTMLPGKRDTAIPLLQELAKEVAAGEPDTWMYTVHTPDFTQPNLPTPPENEVVFIEIYKDKAAFQAHVSGTIFTNFVNAHKDLFLCSEGSPYVTLELLEREAGFIREQAE